MKRSTVYSLFLRALRICDPPYLDVEIAYIRTSFLRLAYPNHIINAALSDAKRRFYSQKALNSFDNTSKFFSVPYNKSCGKLLSTIFRSQNINLVNRSSNSLRSQLVRTKPPCDSSQSGGVYVIPCKDCDSCYVGETGRTLAIRLSEHKRYVRFGAVQSAVFHHVQDKNHNIDWPSAKLVYNSNDKKKRLIVESTLIKKLNNFNNMSGVCSIDPTTENLILSSNRHILNNIPPPLRPH